jgi:hypothetical protein
MAGWTRAAVVRVDDLVVLDGISIKVDPVGGFNDTTRHPAWQISYLHTLNTSKIEEVYQRANDDVDLPRREVEMILASGAECVCDKMETWINSG